MPRLRLWQTSREARSSVARSPQPSARSVRPRPAPALSCRTPPPPPTTAGPDHAVEESAGGLWKTDGAEQQLLRSHNHLDTAAAQRRLPFPAECALKAAIEQAER